MATKKKVAKKAATKAPKGPSVTGGAPPSTGGIIPPPPVVNAMSDIATRNRLAVQGLATQLNKNGRIVVATADQVPNPYKKRRPTGIMQLDIDLAGGWPAGCLSLLSGPDNAGKTWLGMQTLSMQQQLYGDASCLAMGITEGAFPFDMAARAGLRLVIPDQHIHEWVQIREQRGETPYTDEDFRYFKTQPGQFLILRGSTGEEILEAVVDAVKTNCFSTILVDSVQGLRPTVDEGKSMTDNEKQAAHATMISRFCKKYIPITVGVHGVNETTLLMTQQVRANRAKAAAASYIQAYLPDHAITGSWELRHYKQIDVVLSDGAVEKKNKVAVAKTMKWLFEKGKNGSHDHTAGEVRFSYELASGVNFAQTVVDVGQALGVIRTNGKGAFVIRASDGEVLEEYNAPSISKMYERIYTDLSYNFGIRREILAAKGIECLYQ